MYAARHTDSLAPYAVRELEETARCDHVVAGRDLSEVRHAVRSKIGEPYFAEIMTFAEKLPGERAARQAMLHYRSWMLENVDSALTWSSWLRYHLFERPFDALPVLSLSAGAGMRRMILRSARRNSPTNMSRQSKCADSPA